MPILRRFGPNYFHVEEQSLIDNPLREYGELELEAQADAFALQVERVCPDGQFMRAVKNLLSWSRRETSEALSARSSEVGAEAEAEARTGARIEARLPPSHDEALRRLFRKAAVVAQNPALIGAPVSATPTQHPYALSLHEQRLLKRDRETSFWDQPLTLRVTIVTLCFSAIVQGWIQSSANGANQTWPFRLGLTNTQGDWKDTNAKWIFASVNAVTYLAASVFGCWLSDPLQSAFLGRRGAIFISSLICFASIIGSSFVTNWKQLMVCRALVGIGMGAKASVTPIFGAEASPSHLRGSLVMNWQLFDAFGIFLGFTANIVLLNVDASIRWRVQYAAAAIPTFCLLVLAWTIPESSRWLLKHGKHRKAFQALRLLRESELQAAVELFYANAQLQTEAQLLSEAQQRSREGTTTNRRNSVSVALNKFQDSAASTNYFSRILQLFCNARTRRATVATSVVMISQQLCGINIIAFYSSTFFRVPTGPVTASYQDDARQRDVQAAWLSWGLGLANFLFTFPAYHLIDTKGRRFLLFCTYPGMTLAMFGACLSFLDDDGLNVKVAFFMFLFVFFYSWGQGPVAFAYSAEVHPLIYREVGMSFAVFVNLLGAGLLTLLAPLAQTTFDADAEYNLKQAQLLGVFVCFNVIAMILIFLLVPETAGAAIPSRPEDEHKHHSYLRLEELNYIFNVNTRKHIAYQIRHMLPYVIDMLDWHIRSLFRHQNLQKPGHPEAMWAWAMRDELRGGQVLDLNVSQTTGSDRTASTGDAILVNRGADGV